ncbi:hypothetical protein ANTHELSMS3_04530 [Antarctobacter heliothermus]|uniref:Uncharacterized protein n=1 Tax=Antarctobacter heliothermus TaxID=74033 RepID=A0A222EA71_9RHOB|nr:hypothetical protein [Antarctobacter heliothermus]ASP23129.1 hypothetical protein ANTHELSMS3_04530 [Antarctobacter heliothermus]
MKFESKDSFRDWLSNQPQSMCVAIGARAALRVWTILLVEMKHDGPPFAQEREKLALFTGWSMLVALGAARETSRSLEAVANEIESAIATLRSGTMPASLDRAARAAENVAAAVGKNYRIEWVSDHITYTTALHASNAKNSAVYAIRTKSKLAAREIEDATYRDADFGVSDVLGLPLWLDGVPPASASAFGLSGTLLDTDPRFEFFKRWYDSMVRGAPMDWELQRRVALIPQEVWEAGADAVAGAIAEIEAAWEAERQAIEPRWPDFEPRHVTHLFENKIIVSAGVSSLSAMIRQEFERFRAETGLNETPEMFAPLEALPRGLDRIADILTKMEQSDATEQALREEIGRLNAQVANLETELAKAKADCEALQRSSWKTVAAWTIGGANLFGVLATAVWTVSGDEVGAQQRLETLVEYRDVLMGTGQPPIGP